MRSSSAILLSLMIIFWKITDTPTVRGCSPRSTDYTFTKRMIISLLNSRNFYKYCHKYTSWWSLFPEAGTPQTELLPFGEQRNDTAKTEDCVSPVFRYPQFDEESEYSSDEEEMTACPAAVEEVDFGADHDPPIVAFVLCPINSEWCPFPQRCMARSEPMVMRYRTYLPILRIEVNATSREQNRRVIQVGTREVWYSYIIPVSTSCYCGYLADDVST